MRLTYLDEPAPALGDLVAFYRDVLGLEESWRDGNRTVAFWAPDRRVQLMVSTTEQPAGPMYLVDDLEVWTAAHREVPLRVAPTEIPGGVVAGYASPSGQVFYVYDQRQRG